MYNERLNKNEGSSLIHFYFNRIVQICTYYSSKLIYSRPKIKRILFSSLQFKSLSEYERKDC